MWCKGREGGGEGGRDSGGERLVSRGTSKETRIRSRTDRALNRDWTMQRWYVQYSREMQYSAVYRAVQYVP
jgi:hypothetical protein